MILSLVSEKGGTGKSTLALSIATEWMARGKRVLLVDADPQGTSRLACLQAREVGLLAPDCIVGNLELAKQLEAFGSYEHIVIDTPGRLGELQRIALGCSDVALVPVAPTAPDVWALKGVADAIRDAKRLRKPSRALRAALVPTKLMVRTVMANEAEETLKPLGLPVFRSSTFIRAAWAETLTRGQGVAQYAPNSVAAGELKGLVQELTRFAGRQ